MLEINWTNCCCARTIRPCWLRTLAVPFMLHLFTYIYSDRGRIYHKLKVACAIHSLNNSVDLCRLCSSWFVHSVVSSSSSLDQDLCRSYLLCNVIIFLCSSCQQLRIHLPCEECMGRDMTCIFSRGHSVVTSLLSLEPIANPAEPPRLAQTRAAQRKVLLMDKMQVQAAIAALYGTNPAESARANTFLMEFAEQPVTSAFCSLNGFRFVSPLFACFSETEAPSTMCVKLPFRLNRARFLHCYN